MFEMSPLEILALRKLELVSKTLATKLPMPASVEQRCLADVLTDVLDRYEIEAAKPKREPAKV